LVQAQATAKAADQRADQSDIAASMLDRQRGTLEQQIQMLNATIADTNRERDGLRLQLAQMGHNDPVIARPGGG
jgi:uncharacterized protein involved in exopolysaccharide biosynthesis